MASVIERARSDAAPGRPVPGHLVAWVLVVLAGLAGLWASLQLSIDALRLAEDPNAALSCNISDTISCAKVGLTWQANLLGFPNAFLGLMTEPVVVTLGVLGLARVALPRWFMLGALAGFAAGLGFALWLFVQSYFVIGALCPWCSVLYVSTLVSLVALGRICVLDGHLGAGARQVLERPLRLGADTALVVIALAVLVAMVLYKYG
jgi:uncharacterized membrane protein